MSMDVCMFDHSFDWAITLCICIIPMISTVVVPVLYVLVCMKTQPCGTSLPLDSFSFATLFVFLPSFCSLPFNPIMPTQLMCRHD